MSEKKCLVYIAGPITLPKGRFRENAIRACRTAEHIIYETGAVPLIPHLSVFWAETMRADEHELGNGIYNYQQWIDISMNWLMRCDAVLRMPGKSTGADGEVAYAEAHGIPVFHHVYSLKRWIKCGCS